MIHDGLQVENLSVGQNLVKPPWTPFSPQSSDSIHNFSVCYEAVGEN